MDRSTIVHSSSAAAAVEKSWVSLNAEITAGSVEDVGSILLTVSILTKRRLTPWRLPKKEYTRWRASTSSAATTSLVNG